MGEELDKGQENDLVRIEAETQLWKILRPEKFYFVFKTIRSWYLVLLVFTKKEDGVGPS